MNRGPIADDRARVNADQTRAPKRREPHEDYAASIVVKFRKEGGNAAD